MRILVLVSSRNVSGPVKGVFQLIHGCKRAGILVTCVNVVAGDDHAKAFEMGAEENRIPVMRLVRSGKNYFAPLFQLVRMVRGGRVDLVQTHSFLPSFLGFWIKLFTGVPWVCFLHGTTTENRKVRMFHRLESWIQLYADRVVLVSHRQRSFVPFAENTHRVRVLHNAVDPDNPVKFSTPVIPTYRRLKHFRSTRYVVAVGRLSPEKGMDVFVDALGEICQSGKDVHGIVVGDGGEREALSRHITELGMDHRITLVGHTATPGDYLRDASVVVLPSRSEGIPNVALEAMALGKPVVATTVGGIPEVITANVEGILVSPEQPRALAREVCRVLSNEALAGRLGLEGCRRAREMFSVEVRREKMLKMYSELVPVSVGEPSGAGVIESDS